MSGVTEAWIGDVQVQGGSNGIGLTKWYDRPAPRRDYTKKPRGQGGIDKTRFYDGRLFTVEGKIAPDDPDDIELLCDELAGAISLADDPVLLRFRRKGKTYFEQAWVRQATELNMPRELADGDQLVKFGVDLFAADPRVYRDQETTGSYDPAAAGVGGGVGFPLSFPLVFTGTAVADLSAINAGQYPTPPVYEVHGPIGPVGGDTAWSITNVDTGKSIYVTQTLAAGDVLTVDVAGKSVTLNGSTIRPDLVDPSRTRWGDLEPGRNRLRLLGSGMQAGTTELTVTFRSARI